MSALERLNAFLRDRGITAGGGSGLGPGPAELRIEQLAEYRRRRAAIGPAGLVAGPAPGPNWIPLGPIASTNGQTSTRAVVSGRVPDMAVSIDGRRIYVGSANGGVWRSVDAGRTWRSMSDEFDVDPTGTAKVDSLACGAIAIADGGAADQDRVYVGTGEPHNNADAYLGVGMLRSSNGGSTWVQETAIPTLTGSGCFALAVDPADPDHVVAATRSGVYRRRLSGATGIWNLEPVPTSGSDQRVTSVVAHRTGNTTTFYAAVAAGGVITSTTTGGTNSAWTRLVGDAGFPAADVELISLAVSSDAAPTIYALVSKDSNKHLLDVMRIDVGAARWTRVAGVPVDLFGSLTDTTTGLPANGQGFYDIAIAVDPTNRNLFYVGGAGTGGGAYIYRCTVHTTGAGPALAYTAASSSIGMSAHPDVHTLVVSPADHRTLWCACDGGVFVAPNALESTGEAFEARNVGLSTMTLTGLDHHPTLAGYVFCGAQDNGGLRYATDEVWDHHQGGDGGATVVNWASPRQVVNGYVKTSIRQFDTDGARYASTSSGHVFAGEPSVFYPPIAGAPNDGTPAHATRLAWGGNRVFLSDSFGTIGTWIPIPAAPAAAAFPAGANARSIEFTAHTHIYVGTTNGRLWEYVFDAGVWTRTDHGRPTGEVGPITSICTDPSVAGGTAVYLTVGGIAGTAAVWNFDSARPSATQWSARNGTGTNRLLRVHHSVVEVDPNNANNLWVGADIGVWHSTDGGTSVWQPFSNNLPDSAVVDLDLHPVAPRMLRASLHGRGVYEIPADGAAQPAVELALRTNRMDTGRGAAPVAPVLDPLDRTVTLAVDQSPDILTDPPDNQGRLVVDPTIVDPVLLTRDLVGRPRRVLANPAGSAASAITKVYVRVRNRGPVVADGVRVMLLVGRVDAARNDLPAGYAGQVAAGTPIETADWHTVGFRTLDGVGKGRPGIATFDLPSSLVPPTPAGVGQRLPLLALVHHPQDPYNSNVRVIDNLVTNDRRAAVATAAVVAATGAAAAGATVPPPGAASLAPPTADLQPRAAALVPAATALLAHRRLADVVDALTAKVNAGRVGSAPGGFARVTKGSRAEHQVLALAKRARAMYEAGPSVPAKPTGVGAGTGTFVMLGSAGYDLAANVAAFEPGGTWIADTLRRGTPDPHRSLISVAASELALKIGTAARQAATSDEERARVDGFTMGMLAATAAGVVGNPLLADLLAKDTNLDWGPQARSAGAHAVDQLIARRLFGISDGAGMEAWWPSVDEVPAAIWTSFRTTIERELGLPTGRRKGFREFEDGLDPGSWITDKRLRNAYSLWRGDLSTGRMHWTGWWGWVSLFTLASPVALVLNRALPHGSAAFVPGREFDERAAFELLVAGMGVGSIGPFVSSMALWSAIDEHTDPFVEALILFLSRMVLTAVGLGTSGDDGQGPGARWGGVFAPMIGSDVYAAVRAAIAAGDPPGDSYVFAMQTASAINGGLTVLMGALMNLVADETEKEGAAWGVWAGYTALMFLALGMPLGVVFQNGGGWRSWFLRSGPRPSLTDTLATSGLGFPEPSAMGRTFDDSTLWQDPQLGSPAAVGLEHLAYPSGMRGLLRIWSDVPGLEISHDADTVTLRPAGAAPQSVVVPFGGVTTAELVAAITALGIAGLHVETIDAAGEPKNPDHRLPVPETVNDPGDRGLLRDHPSALGLFVAVGADKKRAYRLQHAPRAELSTRQSLHGTSRSDLDESHIVPFAGLGDLEHTGLGAAADLAVLLSLGAVPTLTGGSLAIPDDEWAARFGAGGKTVREINQVFRRWNLTERRSNEWRLLVSGGARSEKAGRPAEADPLMRPYPTGRASDASDGAEWVEAMGWLPLWRAWLRVASDPGTDSEADVAMPFTPVVRLTDGSERALTNAELTAGVRFLLDLEN